MSANAKIDQTSKAFQKLQEAQDSARSGDSMKYNYSGRKLHEVEFKPEMACKAGIRSFGTTNMFLELTRHTCPFGMEDRMYGAMLVQFGFKKDDFGNWYKQIGNNPKVCFMGHLDTVGEFTPVQRELDKNLGMCFSDGKTILGADDKTGVTVILQMVKAKKPGLYYLFSGEESGCIGARKAAKNWKYDTVKIAIEFDRRGENSIITHQTMSRTASDEFADQLAKAAKPYGFHWLADDTGSFTDTNEFADIIPECTNISAGYDGAHTVKEAQDMIYLEQLVNFAIAFDWNELEAKRDPSKPEKSYYKQYRWQSEDYEPFVYKPSNSWHKANSEVYTTDTLLRIVADLELYVRIGKSDKIMEIVQKLVDQYPAHTARILFALLEKYPDIVMDDIYAKL